MHQSKREPAGAELGQWSLDLWVCHNPFHAITEADLDTNRLEQQCLQRDVALNDEMTAKHHNATGFLFLLQRDVALNDEMTAKHRNATGVLFLERGYFGGQWPMFSCQYQSM